MNGTERNPAEMKASAMKRADMAVSDSHAHIGSLQELEIRKRQAVPSLICASCPEEAETLFPLASEEQFQGIILPTCGLHPWQAGTVSMADMELWLKKTSVVGEIGMDSVWCSVPLLLQEEVFRQQLAFSAAAGKPVILHTKGQEAAIASIIKEYDTTYLVHWFSGQEGLSEFLSLDCYFTIGPDLPWNEAVRKAALRIPENRLLVETDGSSAVRWAYESYPSAGYPEPLDIRGVLTGLIRELARLRGREPGELALQIEENFRRFLSLRPC